MHSGVRGWQSSYSEGSSSTVVRTLGHVAVPGSTSTTFTINITTAILMVVTVRTTTARIIVTITISITMTTTITLTLTLTITLASTITTGAHYFFFVRPWIPWVLRQLRLGRPCQGLHRQRC